MTPSAFLTFDVTDPLSPSRLGSYPLASGTAMAEVGSRAYVLDQFELKILDLTNPEGPVLLGSAQVGDDRIRAAGNRIFTWFDQNFSVQVWDVTDPADVALLGVVQVGGILKDVAVRSESEAFLLYDFENQSYIDRLDLSNPSSPVFLDQGGIEGPEEGLAIRDGLLLASGLHMAKFNADDLWPYSSIGVHQFGGTVAIGPTLAYAWDGATFSVFTLNPFQFLGTGVTGVGAEGEGGIAEVGGCLYVTDAQGIHVFAPPCLGASIEPPRFPASTPAGLTVSIPNPFRSSTDLEFRLAAPSAVGLSLSDPSGRVVRTLAFGRMLPAGVHSLHWDGRDDGGREVPAGIYYARLRVNGRSFAGKAVRVR